VSITKKDIKDLIRIRDKCKKGKCDDCLITDCAGVYCAIGFPEFWDVESLKAALELFEGEEEDGLSD